MILHVVIVAKDSSNTANSLDMLLQSALHTDVEVGGFHEQLQVQRPPTDRDVERLYSAVRSCGEGHNRVLGEVMEALEGSLG